MKTQMFRVWTLGVAIVALAFATGCQEEQARAEGPELDKLVPEIAPTAPLLANLEAAPAPLDLAAAAALEKTNVSTIVAMPKLVAKPVMPADLKVTPALAEVLKLAQAGVSDDVMLAYIIHSTNFFDVTSDVIVYLNDLGVSNNVITTLIHHDTTPDMQARRQATVAVQPLPANVVLNTPATNVYPPAVPSSVFAPAPDSTAAPPPPVDAEVATVNPPEDPVTVSYFYSSLAPYGTWVEVDGYGLCWQPTVVVSNPRWRPYCDRGRWLWTDSGWYWYSDYSWGWAPFHYGRWCDYPRLGWIWVPDIHWGPSWVSWRYSSSYCGWAPLPPACHYRPGFGFSYYGRSFGFSFFDDFGLGFHHYNYVPVGRFCDRSPGLHVLRGNGAAVVHRETKLVGDAFVDKKGTIMNKGVGRERIAAANRGSVPTATVRETPARGSVRRDQLVNEGSSLAIVRQPLPEKPERSHVAVPPRSGIARAAVSRGNGDGIAANTSRADAPSSLAGRSARLNGSAVTRHDTPPSTSSRSEGVVRAPAPTANVESAPPPNDSRGAASVGGSSRESRSPSPSTPSTARSSPMFRSYARPGNEQPQSAPEVGASAPAPAPSRSVTRSQPNLSAPVAALPAPNLNRPNPGSAPPVNRSAFNRPSTPSASAPQSPARNSPTVRSYVNPGGVSRPNAGSPPSQISRSAPVARPSFSAPTRSAPSVSRAEPSRSAPSVSAPQRSAPSVSTPARSAPAVSAPSRSSGGPSGRGVGRGRGD